MSGTLLDIIILVVLIISFIVGYLRGFVDRALNLVTSIIMLLIAWWGSKGLAPFFNLWSGMDDPLLSQLIAPLIGRVIAFIVIYLVLALIRLALFAIFKPVIRHLKEMISLVNFADSVLGGIFNVIKSFFIVYLALLVVSLPIVNNGRQAIEDSFLGSLVVKTVPSLTTSVMAFGEQFENLSQISQQADEGMQVADMIEMVDSMNQLGLINEDTITSFYDQYQNEIQNMPVQEVSGENYEKLTGIIDELPASQEIKNTLKSKLSQS